jgi:hypothetical protein
MKDKTEARLQSECYLHFWNSSPHLRKRLFCVHNNPKDKREGAILKSIGLVAGVSDMIYLRDNMPPLCLEFKTETGKQQMEQKEWQTVAESTGAKYVIVRNMTEFCEAVEITPPLDR